MSEETREAAKKTGKRLDSANEYVKEAVEHAKKTGDKQLVERVTKISKECADISTEIKTKTTQGTG
jgi:methyl-accepting chemotaxis protein